MGPDSWSTYCLEEGIFQSPSGKGLLGSGGLASETEGFPRHHNLRVVCQDLIQRAWRVELRHVFREANQVADGLARYDRAQHRGFHQEWSFPPPCVKEDLQRDKLACIWARKPKVAFVFFT